MKVIGLIVEYNPFHNGHIHHINEAKRLSGADCCVVVMSSSFTMRGDISCIDKFNKTKIALNYDIDLVIELPFIYAVENADIFAYNAIYILNKLKVDEIYFGSENNSLEKLKKMALLLDSSSFNSTLQKYLHLSYPKANSLALEEFGFSDISSNDMLGIQYIRAINKLGSKIQPFCIKRINSNYNDLVPTSENIASATAIRNLTSIKKYVPKVVNDYYEHNSFLDNSIFFNYFKYQLIFADLTNIKGFDDNLVGLFKNTKLESFEDINKLVSKKYTLSRIKRLILYIIFDIKKDFKYKNPNYIRILGMNDIGRKYLNTIKKELDIPLISKVKEGICKELDLEIRISRFYSLVSNKNIHKKEFEKIIMSPLE